MARFCCLVIILFLFQCTSKELTKPELQKYILDEANGLYKHTEMNGTKIEVTYKPTDLLVEQEIKNLPASPSTLDSVRKKYNGYYYFTVSISRNNKEALHQIKDIAEYGDLVRDMSFRMPQFVTLTTTQRDTIPVADYFLDRTYGMSSSTNLLFVFNKEKAKGSDWIQFNLNEFGLSVGNQRFRFNVEAITNAPNLKFSIYQ